MKQLRPTLAKRYQNFWVLWFQSSNSYSVVEDTFKTLLDLYFESKTAKDFKLKIQNKTNILRQEAKDIVKVVERYLTQCHITTENEAVCTEVLDATKQKIVRTYMLEGKVVKIYFDTLEVSKVIYPTLDYAQAHQNLKPDVSFTIYCENDKLLLFKNNQCLSKVLKTDFHYVQGKFNMHLICEIHNKAEDDWIGTFHGSSISDGENAVLFVGLSGSGKSTLTALLAANGLELLADDVSPLLAKDLHIYNNPAAISVKKGAFSVMKTYVKDFENLPTVNFSAFKGDIKYLPFRKHNQLHYPCKAIVLVHYKTGMATRLEAVEINEILEPLIPDSWLQNNSSCAASFLDWLDTLEFYKLTYHKNNEAINNVKALLKKYSVL